MNVQLIWQCCRKRLIVSSADELQSSAKPHQPCGIPCTAAAANSHIALYQNYRMLSQDGDSVGGVMTEPTGAATRAGARIQEIAEALGIPLSALYEERAPLPFAEVRDLIREYSAITDAQGRQRVMNVLRREAARCRVALTYEPPSE